MLVHLLLIKTNQYQLKVMFNTIIIIATLFIISFHWITAANKPDDVSYEEVNATAIKLMWSITGDVTGFFIQITGGGFEPITAQLTDGTIREYVVGGLLPGWIRYIGRVRGYNGLLGPEATRAITLLGIDNDFVYVV